MSLSSERTGHLTRTLWVSPLNSPLPPPLLEAPSCPPSPPGGVGSSTPSEGTSRLKAGPPVSLTALLPVLPRTKQALFLCLLTALQMLGCHALPSPTALLSWASSSILCSSLGAWLLGPTSGSVGWRQTHCSFPRLAPHTWSLRTVQGRLGCPPSPLRPPWAFLSSSLSGHCNSGPFAQGHPGSSLPQIRFLQC